VPEAVCNYLCLLGWSPKDDTEVMSLEEITTRFDLANVNRKGAQFDLVKCDWFNAQYLAHMPLERYVELCKVYLQPRTPLHRDVSTTEPLAVHASPELGEHGAADPVPFYAEEYGEAYLRSVLALEKMKVTRLTEVPDRVSFFFTEDYAFDPTAVEKTLRKPGALERLTQLGESYAALEVFDAATLEAKLKELAATLAVKPAEFIHPARVAVIVFWPGFSARADVSRREPRLAMNPVYTLADLQAWESVTAEENPPLRLAVVGDPVAHSASPQMHNAALAACGIEVRYCRLHIRPDELKDALRLLPEKRFLGVNCTIPHKADVLTSVDEVDEGARAAGGVNTVCVCADGRLRGSSTDGPGLARAVREQFGIELSEVRVLVLGAGGGAGRAVAMQCALSGAPRLTLVNRSVQKLQPLYEALEAFYPRESLAIASWGDTALSAALEASDLVVNCSALGMQPGDASPIPASLLSSRHLLYDTIYTAGQTPLMLAAEAAGARSANGLSMLLHQGALSFEHWFQRPAPVEVMRAALVAHAKEKARK
jgi:shikimate dehydrogenase